MFNNITRLTGILFWLLSCQAIALPSDQDKPIQIEAGKVEMNEKEGTSRYSGGVRITQGSRLLTGDEILIESTDNKIDKITISGKPAHFSQMTIENETVEASSYTMVFHAKTEILELTEQAVLKQKDNTFQSEHIAYDANKDVVTAGQPDTDSEKRVKITLHPEKDTTEKP